MERRFEGPLAGVLDSHTEFVTIAPSFARGDSIREETGVEARRGHPVPGVEVKMAPTENKLEARLHGPNITQGFLARSGTD